MDGCCSEARSPRWRRPPSSSPATTRSGSSSPPRATMTSRPRSTSRCWKASTPHWSAWTPESRRDYTNLPAGAFRFRVRARNLYQHESAEAAYAFSITPPWYATWWAYSLYVLGSRRRDLRIRDGQNAGLAGRGPSPRRGGCRSHQGNPRARSRGAHAGRRAPHDRRHRQGHQPRGRAAQRAPRLARAGDEARAAGAEGRLPRARPCHGLVRVRQSTRLSRRPVQGRGAD